MKFSWIYIVIAVTISFFCNCKQKEDTNDPEHVIPMIIPIDLSFVKNPAGNWQIGYSLNDTITSEQFQFDTFVDTSYIIGLWHPASGQIGYYPYIGQNRTKTTQVDRSNSWAAKAGEIVMEGSNIGQYSMLRFVVPFSGMYKIKAVFEGIHFRISSTDVHILLNTQSLFNDIIDGYGGDSLYHAISGLHPTAPYEAIIQLNKNDIITFAVGYGSNKNHYNDTTGLLVYVEAI
jgi:hypothetical protein